MRSSRFLGKAGYHLSPSIILDTVILHTMRYDPSFTMAEDKVFYMNDILFGLDLPLLMTRQKRSNRENHQLC
jgi:hypothetical protein